MAGWNIDQQPYIPQNDPDRTIPMAEFERKLMDGHTCAETHSIAIAFARKIGVPEMTIANLLAAAVLRSNVEVEAFDATERPSVPYTESEEA